MSIFGPIFGDLVVDGLQDAGIPGFRIIALVDSANVSGEASGEPRKMTAECAQVLRRDHL